MINKALRVLWLYNGIFVFSGALFGPLYAVYVQGIAANPFIISITWAVFLLSSTLGMFFIARVGDSIPHKEHLLMAGFLTRALVWVLYIFVGNIYALIILQMILGLSEAFSNPAFNSLAAEHLDKGRHIEEYSDMNIIFNLAGALATVIGGAIVAQFGFTALFLIMAALALVSFLGVYMQHTSVWRQKRYL